MSSAALERLEEIFGLHSSDVLRYADPRKKQRRAVRLERVGEQAELTGFLLAGDTRAQSWIKTLLQDELPAQSYGRLLLSPSATAPLAVASRGKIICTCLGVTDLAIQAHLSPCSGSAEQRLQSLQATLRGGTNCGSCLPELQRMVNRTERDPKSGPSSVQLIAALPALRNLGHADQTPPGSPTEPIESARSSTS